MTKAALATLLWPQRERILQVLHPFISTLFWHRRHNAHQGRCGFFSALWGGGNFRGLVPSHCAYIAVSALSDYGETLSRTSIREAYLPGTAYRSDQAYLLLHLQGLLPSHYVYIVSVP